MKGDFSRNTFDPGNHYSRVLLQQGRVQVDADWNEQAAIGLYYLRSLAADLIGPHGGPGDSFKIHRCLTTNGEIRDENGNLIDCTAADHASFSRDFFIFKGHYYVNGVLCENERPLRFTQQPDYPNPAALEDNEMYLVYLDVWERHVTPNEDDSIREVALGGPDTATRARLVWQVKAEHLTQARLETLRRWQLDGQNESQVVNAHWHEIVSQWWWPEDRGALQARARVNDEMDLDEPCIISPDARYRGAENQLYRVEIHLGSADNHGPTFKWSRENGSVTFPIRRAAGKTVWLAHLGRDGRFTLQEGDWVEAVNEDTVLYGQPQPLCRVEEVDRVEMTVTLDKEWLISVEPEKRPLLRRWDQRKKASETASSAPNEYGVAIEKGWLKLEDGVEIQFSEQIGEGKAQLLSGDYWLIPARTATGDVEWPQAGGKPAALPPLGVPHHFAPLALIQVSDNIVQPEDCRYVFQPIVVPAG